MKIDKVIRGGLIVDGTGGEPFVGDVAISGTRIAAVGKDIDAPGAEVIDATGMMVTPGFVDIHTHYDGQVTWENSLAPSSQHGVTTVLMGNCGVGFAPCRPQDRDRLMRLMEGVEDLPEIVLAEGLPWNWESFPQYMDRLAERSYDVDIAAQLPHAALRVYAMGERASAKEQATPEDIATMAKLAREAVDAGALGFGTSRTLNHVASDGTIVPTVEAGEEELTAIATAFKDAGRGVLQLITDFVDLEDELARLRRIAEAGGRPLSITLLQNNRKPGQWQRVLQWIEECNADGLEVRGQVCGRPTNLLLGFDFTRNPFYRTPTFMELKKLPLEQKREALRDPAVRAKIIDEEPIPENAIGAALPRMWTMLHELGTPPDYEPSPENTLAKRAERMGIRPEELAYDIMLQDDCQGVIWAPVGNFLNYSLDESAPLLRHPNTLYGLGDGGAHLGFLCDASVPTFMLQHWARERTRGLIPVEEVVRNLSWETANAVGLHDRGQLKPGMRADINVIDFDRLQIHPPRASFNLPAGGARITQDASGYAMTLVAGTVTRKNDEATGALPGRLVRGPQTADA